jgi:hypothetical protein
VNRNHRLAALAAATTLALLAGNAAAAGRTDLHGLDVAKLNQQYKAAAAKLGVAANARDRHAGPGETVLTRMPFGARAWARAEACWTTAAFSAE